MDLFYRGYIVTKDKKAVEKFNENTTLKTRAQVDPFDEYAGVLADDAILIDFDDEDEAEKALKIIEENDCICRVYKTTRGIHALFKNKDINACGTHVKLACGLTADIKCGRKSCYEVVKFAGKDRKILYDKFEEEEYDYLPKFFFPIKTKINFDRLEEGDGRNQNLFNYILTLQTAGFTVEEARKCLRLINEYVLPDKLSNRELEQIMRDDAFNAPIFYDDKGRFLFDKFALYMISEHNIIKIDGNLYIFDDGVYTYNPLMIENYMLSHIPNLNKATRSEIMAYIEVIIAHDTEPAPARYIAFNNGVYDVEDKVLRPYDPDMILLNKIPHNFNPNAYDPVCDNTLNKLACNDTEIRNLLEESIGYCFYRRNELRKSFMLIGDKANGKSTFLDMVRNVLGLKNIASLDVHELGDRFKTAELCGKLANIGDDISDGYMGDTSVFKKVVSGDRLNVERKGENPFEFDNYSKQLFSANTMPRVKDNTGAVMSRLIMIKFKNTFSKNDPDFDPFIKYKLRSENTCEYLINLGIRALHNVLARNAFTEIKEVEEMINDYNLDCNPLEQYFMTLDRNDIVNNSTMKVYTDYRMYIASLGSQPLAEGNFAQEVKKYFGCKKALKRIDNKGTWVYE